MILICGATGAVGGETLRQLIIRGVPVRALVRRREQAPQLANAGVEVAIGDLEKADTLGAALDGVSKALLVSPLDPRLAEIQGSFIDTATRCGHIHIVKLSGLGTALDSPLRSGRWHAEAERHLEDSGLPFTHLRPPYFMQNILRFAPGIAANGLLVAAMKTGRIAMIDVRDIAAVAATILTSHGHAGKAYTITGPEALSFRDVAAKLATATGRLVTYKEVASDVIRQQMVAAGMPEWLVEVRMEFNAHLSEGYAAAVTAAVTIVTGEPPRSFDDFAREHAALFGSD